MLAVAVDANGDVISQAIGVTKAGAHRTADAEPLRQPQPPNANLPEHRLGLIRRAIVDHQQVEVRVMGAKFVDDRFEIRGFVEGRNQSQRANAQRFDGDGVAGRSVLVQVCRARPHAVHRPLRRPNEPPAQPHRDGSDPDKIAEEMKRHEEQGRPIVGPLPGAPARHRPFASEERDERRCGPQQWHGRRLQPLRCCGACDTDKRRGHHEWMRHHPRVRHRVAAESARMLGNDVQASVAEAGTAGAGSRRDRRANGARCAPHG